jgi:hypothetical protein
MAPLEQEVGMFFSNFVSFFIFDGFIWYHRFLAISGGEIDCLRQHAWLNLFLFFWLLTAAR